MDKIMVYLIVRGLESISFDNLFTNCCDLSTSCTLQQLLSPQYQEVHFFLENYK